MIIFIHFLILWMLDLVSYLDKISTNEIIKKFSSGFFKYFYNFLGLFFVFIFWIHKYWVHLKCILIQDIDMRGFPPSWLLWGSNLIFLLIIYVCVSRSVISDSLQLHG